MLRDVSSGEGICMEWCWIYGEGPVRLRTTSTKSETQIGARGFVAVEVMWQLGSLAYFGLLSLASSMSRRSLPM